MLVTRAIKAAVTLVLLAAMTGISFGDTQMVVQLKDGNRTSFFVSTIDRIEHVKGGGASHYFTQGLNLHAEGKYREAIEAFSYALQLDPKNDETITARGTSYYMMKDYERAITDFDSAIKINGQNAWAYMMRGTVKKEMRNASGAISDLKKAIEIDPSMRSARISLSSLYLEENRASEAIPPVSYLIERDALDKEAREIRAKAYGASGNFTAAISDLDILIKQDPSQASYYALRGISRLEMKDEAGAREDLARGKKLNPANEDVKKLEAKLAGVTLEPPPVPAVSLSATPNINDFTANNELHKVAAAMESLRLLMGNLSPEEEKKFLAEWGPLFEFPTEESGAYFDKLNELIEELHVLRGQVATAAHEFDAAWEEAVIAASYGSEKGTREALSIAEKQKDMLSALQARMSQIAKAIQSLGNPPPVKEEKTKARKTHKEAVKVVKKVMKKEAKTEPKKEVSPVVTASIRKEGNIIIIPSTEIVTAASTIEVNAEVPPHIADKAKEYKWQSRGTYPIIIPATRQPRALLATDYFGDVEEITITAFDANGKEIGSGRIIIPMKSPKFLYNLAEYAPKSAGVSQHGPNIIYRFESPEEVSTYQTKNTIRHRDGTIGIEVKHHDSKLTNEGYIDIHFASHSKSDTLTKIEEIRQIYERFEVDENKSKSFYDLTIGDFTGRIYEYQNVSLKYPANSYQFSGQGYLLHKGVNACTYGLYVSYRGGSYAYHCPIYETEQPCAQKVRNNFQKLKDAVNKAVRSVHLTLPDETEKIVYEEDVDIENKEERIAFHEANIRIIESNLARDEQELAKEVNPDRRGALEWRILNAKSDLLHEKDLIMSIKTGTHIHTRTPFEDFAHNQLIEKIKENQRRMEEYSRTIAAMNRLAGMLPEGEAEGARDFVRRQLPPHTMANMDRDKAQKVANAIYEKVQGYYQKEAAKAEEKEAWANFGLEAAQNIKAGADAGMFACSLVGGKGVMIAYQGVTGYIDGGPKEAVLRAASWYSTPTYVAAEALRGYESGGVKGAAEGAAISFISGKAFEYGASKIGSMFAKSAGTATGKESPTFKPSGTEAASVTKVSTQSVNEALALEQFKAARSRGEDLAKKFSKAQKELQELGKKGATAEEIIKKQAEVRKLVSEVNSNPHAKNFLKYRGDALSQRAYNAHLRSVHAEVEANFHELMKQKGWNKQELKEFRNAASAGSVGMDYDIGLVEKPTWVADKDGKLKLNKWLTKNGEPQTVDKWQKDAQEAWNESYKKVTGQSAEKSWETVTTSAHAESYRDLNILSKDKTALKKAWAEQTADVTRYKMHHIMNDPHLSYLEKLQEISRGTAKDMETKLIPLLEKAQPKSEASVEALNKSIEHWKKIKTVLSAFGDNTIDPIKANRIIMRHTGGKSIPEVVDDASVLLESLIKQTK
ncbi:MAG: tetratricopeptide repeat protein [Syntrophales bacterium]|nr:tetratricopeptide repeat protein [Syntrophales bacterium]